MRKKPALLTKVMDKMEDYEKTGMFVINTPVRVFSELSGRGVIFIDPHEFEFFVVRPLGLAEYSAASTIEYVPQNSYRMFKEF